MSKLRYASIYAIIATILIGFLVYMGRNTDKKQSYVKRQIYVILLMDILYFISFFSDNSTFLFVNYNLVRLVQIISEYMFVVFAILFTGNTNAKLKPVRITVDILVAMDIVMLAINAFTGFFFGYSTFSERDITYIIPDVNVVYIMQLMLCGALLVLFIGIIVAKIRSVSDIYKFRYFILAITFAIGATICLAFRIAGVYSNFVSVLIITMGECVIFDVFYHVPRVRMDQMKNFAIRNITLSVIIFDDNDELEFVNEPAKDILNVNFGMSLDAFISDNNLKYILTPERRKSGKTKEFTLTLELKQKRYLLHGQELWDEKSSFVGTLLVYNDISKQEKLKDEATYHATRDSLTGLWNREYFFEMVDKTLIDNPEKKYIMIVSDIVRFKMFNDILGKRTGDDLILTIANGIKERRNLQCCLLGWQVIDLLYLC